jgi:hypothetical protein
MVWRAERTHAHQAGRGVQHAGHAVNFCSLQRFFKRERRKNAGDALGQHGLAGAGRPDHEDVVPAGAGNFQRALGRKLSAHFLEVRRANLVGLTQHLGCIHGQR